MALRIEGAVTTRPLRTLTLRGATGTVTVSDGQGREYFRAQGVDRLLFVVGGALGTHTIWDAADETTFDVTAETGIEGGPWGEGFDLAVRSMRAGFRDHGMTDGVGRDTFDGTPYRWYVMWNLDQAMVAQGMRWFDGGIREFVNLHALGQREDGMIWSFHEPDDGPGWYETAYAPLGFVRSRGGLRWVRQPAENHPEAFFVRCLVDAWRASGDDAWARSRADAGIAALDYVVSDPFRFRDGLLVRPYTIDMWDFQPDDPTLPPGIGARKMLVTPGVTKLTAFYGDNTLYAESCRDLAGLLERLDRPLDAARLRTRAEEILARTLRTCRDGDTWIHKVELDPTVDRGISAVLERERLSYSSALSLTRGIPGDLADAILDRYERLRDERPEGSPGEGYFMYPPYEAGFAGDSERWEYMNGGVSACVMAAIALGAFARGRAEYGRDVLARAIAESKRDGRIHWGWRGAAGEPAPAGPYRPFDLTRFADMALVVPAPRGRRPWMEEATAGNDLGGFPEGPTEFRGVPFAPVGDAVGLAERSGWNAECALPAVGRKGSISLLHTAGGIGPEGLIGFVTWRYVDGSERTVAVRDGVHGGGWWFPKLTSEVGEVAWAGPSGVSARVGTYSCTIDNPEPEKSLASIRLRAAPTGARWAILAATLSDSPAAKPVRRETGGGPDNWPPAQVVHAMIEGLAGVRDDGAALSRVRLTPRWGESGEIAVTARYGASDGYVAYRYRRTGDETSLVLSGSGERVTVRIPWPTGEVRATVDGQPAPARTEEREDGRHVCLEIDPRTPCRLVFRPAS